MDIGLQIRCVVGPVGLGVGGGQHVLFIHAVPAFQSGVTVIFMEIIVGDIVYLDMVHFGRVFDLPDHLRNGSFQAVKLRTIPIILQIDRIFEVIMFGIQRLVNRGLVLCDSRDKRAFSGTAIPNAAKAIVVLY